MLPESDHQNVFPRKTINSEKHERNSQQQQTLHTEKKGNSSGVFIELKFSVMPLSSNS